MSHKISVIVQEADLPKNGLKFDVTSLQIGIHEHVNRNLTTADRPENSPPPNKIIVGNLIANVRRKGIANLTIRGPIVAATTNLNKQTGGPTTEDKTSSTSTLVGGYLFYQPKIDFGVSYSPDSPSLAYYKPAIWVLNAQPKALAEHQLNRTDRSHYYKNERNPLDGITATMIPVETDKNGNCVVLGYIGIKDERVEGIEIAKPSIFIPGETQEKYDAARVFIVTKGQIGKFAVQAAQDLFPQLEDAQSFAIYGMSIENHQAKEPLPPRWHVR